MAFRGRIRDGYWAALALCPLHVADAAQLRSSTAVCGRVLAGLEAFGATVALVWLLAVPHAPDASPAVVAACLGGAYLIAAVNWARVLSFRTVEALLALTTVLISLALHFAGTGGGAFALFYVLAALFGFAFLRPARALLQGMLIAVAYGVVLLTASHPVATATAITVWVFLVGVVFCSGGLLLALSEGLRRGERRYRQLFERNPHPMWVYDCQTLRFVAVNERAISDYGYSRQEFLSMTILDIRPPRDRARLRRSLGSVEAEIAEGDIWQHVTKSGQVIDVEVLADHFEFDRRPARLVVATDVSARLEVERRLRDTVDHDPLTGLLSRSRLEREINALVEDGSSTDSCAVALLGLDHFKLINDSFGHQRGDELICQVASVLAERLEPQHRLGRLGGDAFALLLPQADESRAAQIVAGLLDAVRAAVVQPSRQITASAGIAACRPGEAVRAQDLLVAADIALYEAKDAGRDRWAVATGLGRGHTWIDEIREALDSERFVLHSQPIVDLRSDAVEREELLVRMVGRDGDLIPPASFIPASERFGLINHIDRWVVGQALDLARQGRRVAVNLSAHSLGDRAITGLVADAVSGGMDPGGVMFELTETALAANYQEAADFADRLSRIGCGFALDDFGTGYGTLTYLKHIPFSYLKIDREFVRELSRETPSQRIVKVVVQTASELGQKTIAEGVEDAETMNVLRELGVHYAQGYHIARPAPVGGAAVLAG